jgi:hypothetical protein
MSGETILMLHPIFAVLAICSVWALVDARNRQRRALALRLGTPPSTMRGRPW